MNEQQIPLKIVGSSVFGKNAKISMEETYNMYISDDWLVCFPGYKKVLETGPTEQGRGIFVSTKINKMILISGQNVFTVDQFLSKKQIGTLDTQTGDVFVAENNANQIAICDQKDLYLYNYSTGTFTKPSLDFVPGHIEFQDGYFIATKVGEATWRLSDLNDGSTWSALQKGGFQTKANNTVATVAMPGRTSQLLVVGQSVAEPWANIPSRQLFPYQRSSAYNLDYGCLNPNTIAKGKDFIVYLGKSQNAGLAILVCSGSGINQISTDGINFKLSELVAPQENYGYLITIEGHLFYQITFTNVNDNLTLIYDFNTDKFFHLTDEYGDHHIAKKAVAFNNSYYFISFDDGDLYELNSQYTTYNDVTAPRTRVCNTVRVNNGEPFIGNTLSFVTEQGESSDISRIDLSVSADGGVNFGNDYPLNLNPLGHRINRVFETDLGLYNEFTPQFKFWGNGRFVVNDAQLGVYQ